MKSHKNGHKKLKELLIRAYHEKEKSEVDELWQVRVMSHIRSLGPISSRERYFMLFEQSVWRLAPVTCLLILVLAAFLIKLDLIPDYEMTKLFIDDPLEFIFVEWFGV
jgi:hypothetical protein